MDQSNIIALKEVESRYTTKSQEQLYLKSINLTVPAGDTIAIIGRSGAGKSALLRCIGLIDRPLTGIISIDNKNLTFLASRELANERRCIAYVTNRATFLNSKTVTANIALPLQIQGLTKEETNRRVAQVLAKTDLEGKANNLPQQLSQLQKIQLDLARNLVNNTKVLLCDDIFNGLDQRSTESLITLLRNLQLELKLTILISTNDPEIIKNFCQSAIIMHLGSIIEKCSVHQLFTKPESDVAKDFIRFTTKHELPWSFRRKMINQEEPNYHALVRINFTECLAPEEILSNTLEAFELKMSIIQAFQETIQQITTNIMLIEIFGNSETTNQAITFLNNNGLQSEIIGYVPDSN